MQGVRRLRIFFSSPGDVKMERETARKIVARLQLEVGDAVVIEPYFWEHEVMSATRDYQQNIPEMSSFDVVVCMLWSRLGTPLNPERHPRPEGGFFESGTEYEFYTAMSCFREKGTPNIFVFRNFTEPRRPSRPKEAREAADREIDRVDHFFDKYFKDGNYFTAAVNEYRTLGEFEDKLSLGLRSYLLDHVNVSPQQAHGVAHYQGQPYLGLAAFDFSDAQVFFGRTAQVGDVIESLQEQEMEGNASAAASRRFVLILGASGSGKSSLARAGVLPMLVQNGVIEGATLWRRCVFKPADVPHDPILSLASALIKHEALPELAADGTSTTELAEMMKRQPAGVGMMIRQALSQASVVEKNRIENELREQIRALQSEARQEDVEELEERLKNLTSPTARLAFVADQLEELFTSSAGDATVKTMIEILHSIATCGRVHVVATLRSDFYAYCLEHPLLVELMHGKGSYPLPPPSPGDIAQMIRQPAITAGLAFEENSSTGDKLDEVIRDAALVDPSALPLLSYTLEQLYEKRRSDGMLTFSAYQELGGLAGAIGKRAEETYQGLPSGAKDSFDEVWRSLVTLGDDGVPVRRRVAYEQFTSQSSKELVEAFVKARLLTADHDEAGNKTLSVAHEALLRQWSRVTDWLESNKDFLRIRARIGTRLTDWEDHGKTNDQLIPRGTALAEAEHVIANFSSSLDEKELAYIRASIHHAKTRERAKLKRARMIALGATALSCLALAGGFFAWKESQKAKHHAADALAKKADAEKAEATAKSSQVRAAYMQGVDLLDHGQTQQGLTSLMSALKTDPTNREVTRRLYSYHLYGMPKAKPIFSALGPKGSRQRISGAEIGEKQICSYLSRDHAVEAYDIRNRKKISGDWEKEPDSLAALTSPDSSYIINIRADATTTFWFLNENKKSTPIHCNENFVTICPSYSGKILYEARKDKSICVWETSTGKLLHTIQHEHDISTITLDASDNKLYVAGKELVIYDTKNYQIITRHSLPDLVPTDIKFSGDYKIAIVRFLNTTSSLNRFLALSTLTGEQIGERKIECNREVFDYCVNYEGSEIGVASFYLNAQVYHLLDERLDKKFPVNPYPTKIAFSPDQLLLLAANSEGTLQIFDASTGLEEYPAKDKIPAQSAVEAKVLMEPIHFGARIEDLTVSGDGRYLLAATAEKAQIYDLSVGKAIAHNITEYGTVSTLHFSKNNGDLISSGSWGYSQYDPKTLAKRSQSFASPIKDKILEISGNEEKGFAFGDNNSLMIYDIQHMEKPPIRYQSKSPLHYVSISPNGKFIAATTDEGIVLINTSDGKEAMPMKQMSVKASSFALDYTDDSTKLIAAEKDHVYYLDTNQPKEFIELPHRRMVLDVSNIKCDGNFLIMRAYGAGMKTEFPVLVWNLDAPDREPVEISNNETSYCFSISHDGKFLATGTKNHTLTIWSLATGEQAALPITHTENVVQFAEFSPDDRYIVSVTGDNNGDLLHVWDWKNSRQVSQNLGNGERILKLTYSPDGKKIVTVSKSYSSDEKQEKNHIAFWELEPSDKNHDDLYALTEAVASITLNEQGTYTYVDPLENWKKAQDKNPDSWFFKNPALRSISPDIHYSTSDWLRNADTTIDQARSAMPAVALMRAAVAYWKNRNLMPKFKKWDQLAPDSEESISQKPALVAEYEETKALIKAAEKTADQNADVFAFLAKANAEIKDDETARKWLLKTLELSPQHEDVLDLANSSLSLNQDLKYLAPVAEKLYELNPTDSSNFRIASVRANQNRMDEAKAIYSSILTSKDMDAFDRDLIYCMLDRYPEALRELNFYQAEKIKADANYQASSALLGYYIFSYWMNDQKEEALAHVEKLFIKNPAILDDGFAMSLNVPSKIALAFDAACQEYKKLHPKK